MNSNPMEFSLFQISVSTTRNYVQQKKIFDFDQPFTSYQHSTCDVNLDIADLAIVFHSSVDKQELDLWLAVD